jgi:predicted DNA-binding transcriptional regulator AlpA
MSETKRLLTPEEAGRLLGVGIQTLSNWRTRKVGPIYVKVGQRLIRYREDDLQAFVDASTAHRAA